MTDRRILLGVIGRPHGVRGLVRVQSYTSDPASLAAYGPLLDESGRRWTLSWRGEGIAALQDEAGQTLAGRDEAARLTNTRLFIERDRLPPADNEDEFYLSDLAGLTAVAPDGQVLGRVATVHDYGAGTSLEIAAPEGAAPLLVPFTRACVPSVDVAAGRLVIVVPDEIAVVDEADAPAGAA